jgi:hypothetical protein
LGAYGRLLKEVIVGEAKKIEKERQPIKTVYYCSFSCSEEQADKEEEELWKKGDCKECKKPLAVINDDCQELEHKKLGCLLPINNTPDCLKKVASKVKELK